MKKDRVNKTYYDEDKLSEYMQKMIEDRLQNGLKYNRPCEDFSKMVYKMITGLTYHRCFNGYDEDMKSDFISEAVYGWLKYSHNYNAQKGIKVSTYILGNARMAFISIINKMKKKISEESLLESAFQDFDEESASYEIKYLEDKEELELKMKNNLNIVPEKRNRTSYIRNLKNDLDIAIENDLSKDLIEDIKRRIENYNEYKREYYHKKVKK